MNLKESFRYQNFLETMMDNAGYSLINREHSLVVAKRHLKSKVNPDVQDTNEVVDVGDFYRNDDVLRFMLMLVDEREKLTTAIEKAKSSVSFDLDAAIETNKFRQIVMRQAKTMLRYTASKKIEQGTDYKFNVEGNQTQYFYDIEVDIKENFDRKTAKSVVRELSAMADQLSASIDSAMINTQVDYKAPFDVNDSFEDVMEAFLEEKA